MKKPVRSAIGNRIYERYEASKGAFGPNAAALDDLSSLLVKNGYSHERRTATFNQRLDTLNLASLTDAERTYLQDTLNEYKADLALKNASSEKTVNYNASVKPTIQAIETKLARPTIASPLEKKSMSLGRKTVLGVIAGAVIGGLGALAAAYNPSSDAIVKGDYIPYSALQTTQATPDKKPATIDPNQARIAQLENDSCRIEGQVVTLENQVSYLVEQAQKTNPATINNDVTVIIDYHTPSSGKADSEDPKVKTLENRILSLGEENCNLKEENRLLGEYLTNPESTPAIPTYSAPTETPDPIKALRNMMDSLDSLSKYASEKASNGIKRITDLLPQLNRAQEIQGPIFVQPQESVPQYTPESTPKISENLENPIAPIELGDSEASKLEQRAIPITPTPENIHRIISNLPRPAFPWGSAEIDLRHSQFVSPPSEKGYVPSFGMDIIDTFDELGEVARGAASIYTGPVRRDAFEKFGATIGLTPEEIAGFDGNPEIISTLDKFVSFSTEFGKSPSSGFARFRSGEDKITVVGNTDSILALRRKR